MAGGAAAGSLNGRVRGPEHPRPLLVLASASPRRRQLLRQLGVPFRALPADLDEDAFLAALPPGLAPHEVVERLALAKARRVAGRLRRPQVVLAADTTVVLDGQLIQKPRDAAEARHMLSRLAGRTHEVYTGIALVGPGVERVAHERTLVTMAPADPGRIERYVRTGEPLDKAGAYAVQGYGSVLVERIEGCYFNVVGLPLPLLDRLLAELGVDVSLFWRERIRAVPVRG